LHFKIVTSVPIRQGIAVQLTYTIFRATKAVITCIVISPYEEFYYSFQRLMWLETLASYNLVFQYLTLCTELRETLVTQCCHRSGYDSKLLIFTVVNNQQMSSIASRYDDTKRMIQS